MANASGSGFSWLSLGGVGEIGKNCYVIEVEDKIIVIDCGMSFPDLRMFGVDIVIPDFSYLVKNQHRIRGIVLTHAHEDHIGSLPYLLQDLKKAPPIYGAKFTLALVRDKLAEFNLGETVLTEFKPGDDFHIDGILVQTVRVTHSIPDTCSIAIETPGGMYVHSADFKFDPDPVDGKLTDFAKLERIAAKGVLAFAVDTTNVENPGHSGSESTVQPVLRDMVAAHRGRVFITTFASNIHRLQQAINVAAELKRKVLVLGRTMVDNVQLAQDLGYLKVPKELIVSPQEAEHVRPERLLVILTGSQGEPLAAMARLANGDHRFVTVQPNDLFIFSARPIPGNETAIFGIIDDLFRLGAEVIFGVNAGVHVSGHGYQDEIRQYVKLLDPEIVIPHHGMFRMQMRCRKLCEQWGWHSSVVPIVSIGERWSVQPGGVELIEEVKSGEVFIAGNGASDISRRVINERLALAEDGVLVFSVVLSADGSEILAGPELMSKGFLQSKDQPELFDDINAAVRDSILRNKMRGPEHSLQLRNNVQNAIQRVIFSKTKINPMVIGMVSYANAVSQTA
ncbi:ribonuclease J [bacterium]|nr:ribonuclease J [bacterium]